MPTDLTEWVDPPYCVGRRREEAFLQSALHDAALGSGSVTLVEGATGIGKSRLIGDCIAAAPNVAALAARCVSQPLPGGDLRSQVARLQALLERKPVVVAVDDAHLAGPRDLQTLAALASMASVRRLALIVALDDAHPQYATIDRLRSTGMRKVRLDALDATSMEILVHGLLRARNAHADGTLLQEIVDTAAGNPRYAIELVDGIDAAPSAGTLVPQSARALVEYARRKMSPSSYEVLVLCSALADRFEETSLAKIAERSLAEIVAALEQGCDCTLIREDPQAPGRFAFRHPAIRKAVYFSVISAKRRMLHERIVGSLSANARDQALLLADQWIALDDRKRAVGLLAEHGHERLAKRDFTAAAEAYRRALGLLESGAEEWLSLARGLLECYDRLGQNARIIPIAEAIRALDGFARLGFAVRTLELLFFAYLNECDADKARDVAAHMSEIASEGERRSCTSANMLLAYAYAHAGRTAEAAPLLAGAARETFADNELRWRQYICGVAFDARRKPLADLLARTDAAVEVAKKIGVGARVYAYDEATDLALQHGDLAEAERLSRESVNAAKGAPNIARLGRDAAKCAALLQYFRGDLIAARTLLVENLHWRDSGKYIEAFEAGIGVAVGVHLGDLSVVDAYFDPELLARAVSKREAELCGILLPGFSEIMRARTMNGDLDDAVQACVSSDLVDPYLSVQACAARYGATDLLDRVERQVTTFVCESVTPIAPVHAALVRAIVARRRGRLAEAEGFARDAARGYARFGWRLRHATALELAGDAAGAATIFAGCGAASDAQRVRAGQRRKMRRAQFGARLTLREAEVARLVARRRPDREIAQALQISVRTVHHHVEAILSKLGVRDRTHIAASLRGTLE